MIAEIYEEMKNDLDMTIEKLSEMTEDPKSEISEAE
jgi:hypothetical protein